MRRVLVVARVGRLPALDQLRHVVGGEELGHHIALHRRSAGLKPPRRDLDSRP